MALVIFWAPQILYRAKIACALQDLRQHPWSLPTASGTPAPRVTTKNASRHGGNTGKMVLGNCLEVPESTTGGKTRLFHEPIPINHCTCHANN